MIDIIVLLSYNRWCYCYYDVIIVTFIILITMQLSYHHNHIVNITFSITMELRAGEAAVDKLKARFEVQARGDGEVLMRDVYD